MSVTVQASKHPLKPDWVYAEVEAGQSIYEIAGGAPVVAYINGNEVAEELHRLTRVKDGATLILWPVPQDGDLFRTVALIAVSLAAGPAATALLGGATSGPLFTAVKIGIGIAGSLAVNALIPPQQPEQPSTPESFNRLNAITGAGNRTAAFQPIPRLYGTFQFFPSIPMTAKPFTEVVGNDQYLRMMVCFGYGPLEVGGLTVGGPSDFVVTEQNTFTGSPVKIGDTDINLFDEVEYEIGRPDQISLYTNEIIETDPAFTTSNDDFEGIDDDGAVTKTDGQSAIRTTDTGASEISLDFAGALYSVNKDARTTGASVNFKIEYRETGTSAWIVEQSSFTVFSSKKETVRRGYRFKVTEGQYDVRVTRLQTTHNNTSGFQNELTWTALRTIRSSAAFTEPDMVVMALRIKATDQLNGRIDNLSVLATSVLDAWDGSQWVRQATNNPAWVYADIWTGTANRNPINQSDLDAAALLDWANYCDSNGLEYNGIFDSTGTTLERAREVAGAGLASWAFNPDSKVSVIKEVVDSVPRMVISPRNSFNFGYEVSAVEIPEGLRVQFIDETTWENTERLVFDDGFDESNAQKYETLQAKGVTDPDQAWKYGRYHLAQQRLRPERFTFKQDVQHLRYQRGDLLTINHDVILVGLSAGRVAEVVSDTEIVVDETIFFEEGKSYGIKIQKASGLVSTVGVANDFPSSNTLVLNNAVNDINPDDLIVFGEIGRESIDVKVTEIQPEGDFTAMITTVPAAQNVLDALTGNIPAYDPLINEPIDADRVLPEVPSIDDPSIRGGATSVINVTRDGEGSPVADLFVTVNTQARFGQIQKSQLRYREVGTQEFITLPQQDSNIFKVEDVNVGTTYEFQARGVKDNIFSAWSTPAVQYTVEDESALAPLKPTVTNLTQSDVQLPPIGTVQSYIIVEYQLGGGATSSLIEVKWEAPSVSPLTETYEAEAGIIRVPVNTYGETYSVSVRARSVHGYWSEFSDVDTITPTDPSVTNQDLIDFISNDISESQLAQDLNDRIDIIDENGGLLDRMDNVETSVSTLDGEVDNNATAISVLDSRVTSNDGDISAVSQDLTQLSTTVDGNTSTIQTQASSIDGLEAQYTVKIDNNGAVAGFGLASTTNSDTTGGQFSEFYVNADRFAILPQGGTIGSDDVSPFIVQNNQVFIDDAVIADGSIDNAKIGNVIESDNYVAGSTGWNIDKNGNAEFNDAVFRGQLDVKSSDTGARTEITDDYIKVFDENGTLRVQIGDLTA